MGGREFVPYLERYFEDYTVGEVVKFGDHLVTEEEIVSFAKAYDRQPFHTDPEAAKESHFGGLVSSGWMTGAIVMSLFCDHFIPQCSAMGSPGIDKVRWLRPVRPGDHLRARATILRTVLSQSRRDRGVVTILQEAINQNGQTVMSYEGRAIFACRPRA
ncbi:MaoC family dehydratase [Aromatoleum aromaticum]|uniref:MaoC family dehydratase n=1 Tax=Aromatoleum aromaticum TaxID=551760 RepID=UPI001459DF4C|nr:MaoC family dehydratase [Aromatoleum aromaticum]NMG55170.1 acyl dehydratase [Aromatoleum aromaticum]